MAELTEMFNKCKPCEMTKYFQMAAEHDPTLFSVLEACMICFSSKPGNLSVSVLFGIMY